MDGGREGEGEREGGRERFKPKSNYDIFNMSDGES